MILDEHTYRIDPFRSMEMIQNEMNRLFGITMGTMSQDHPPMNIWAGADEVVVTAELPGMDPAEVRLMVQNDELVIEGNRKEFKPKAEDEVHRQERIFGPFKRSVTLPFRVDAEKIRAKYSDGILTVTLPRPEAEKPRKIEIAATA